MTERVELPYRRIGEVAAPRPLIVVRRASVILHVIAFIICWMMRMRVVLALDFGSNKLELWIEDGWTRRRGSESVTTTLSQFPKLAEYILVHPSEVAITIVTDSPRRSYRESLSIPSPMLQALRMVVAAAWLDLECRRRNAGKVEHGRSVWIRYEERLLLTTWRA